MSAIQRLGVLLLVGLAFVLGSAWQFAGAQAEKAKPEQKWEYLIRTGGQEAQPDGQIQRMVNELGLEGWELVAVEPATAYGRGNATLHNYRVFHFKRPK